MPAPILTVEVNCWCHNMRWMPGFRLEQKTAFDSCIKSGYRASKIYSLYNIIDVLTSSYKHGSMQLYKSHVAGADVVKF